MSHEGESFDEIKQRLFLMLDRIVNSALPDIDREARLEENKLPLSMTDDIQVLRQAARAFSSAPCSARHGLSCQAYLSYNTNLFFNSGKIYTPKGWIEFEATV